MPPLAPPEERKAGPRQRHADKATGAGALIITQRSASFHHGRGAAEQQQQQRHHHHQLLRQRPRTQPDLLAGVVVRGRGLARPDAAVSNWAGGARGRAAPAPLSKVLVTVAVQRSMWPLHVMARAEWRVADLVAVVAELYVREGRRPPLPTADPSAFTLHYSQFSLQSLDPEEKLVELGSRSFFLCSKAAPVEPSSTFSSAGTNKTTASPAKGPSIQVPWLGCTVCLEEYAAKDVVRVLPACGHAFHAACIDAWLRQQPTCPVCRASLRATKNHPHHRRHTTLDAATAPASRSQQVPASTPSYSGGVTASSPPQVTADQTGTGPPGWRLEIVIEEPGSSAGDQQQAAGVVDRSVGASLADSADMHAACTVSVQIACD